MSDGTISIMALLSIIADAQEALKMIKAEGLELSEETSVAVDASLRQIKDEIFGGGE